MTKGSIMVDLDDPRAGLVAEIMTNGTCKRILRLLGDHELSESELVSHLNLPANTINYNIKKLLTSGLIETRSSFWSLKGRSVKRYRVSNKRIVISPRTIKRGVLPAFLVSVLIALSLRWYGLQDQVAVAKVSDGAASLMAASEPALESTSRETFYQLLVNAPASWAWFLIGALTALAVYLTWAFLSERQGS